MLQVLTTEFLLCLMSYQPNDSTGYRKQQFWQLNPVRVGRPETLESALAHHDHYGFHIMSFRLTFVALVLTAQTVLAQQPAVKKRQAPPVVKSINDTMQHFVDSGDISGAVTLVSHRGKLIHLGAVGLANIESQKKMRPANLFAIASMTKPIVATGVMILQDEGKLSIDDDVQEYLPAFANVKLKDGTSPNRPMTIRDCLTHTSGLAGSQVAAGLPSLAVLVDELAKRPLAFHPGEKWQYSPGLNVAGRIIEVVSEQPLEIFLQERIFAPLKMNQTTFFPDAKKIRRTATIYNQKDGKLVPELGFLGELAEIKHPNPSGGLISSARDMQRFYQMMLRRGKGGGQQIVSRAAVRAMTKLQTGDLKTGFTPGNGWGLGWCVIQKPKGVSEVLSQGTFGHGGAFGTQGWVDPVNRTVFVLMIQRKGLPNSDNSDIRRRFQKAAVDAIQSTARS